MVPSILHIETLEQCLGYDSNICTALAQGRHVDEQDGQPVIEVQPEAMVLDGLFQIPVGRSNDADVNGNRLMRAEAADTAFLQDPQQIVLQVIGHIPDFIEEQGPAIGRFKKSFASFTTGPCKGSARIAKEFTF